MSNNAIFMADNFLWHSILLSLVCTFVCTSVSDTKNSFFIIIITLCLRLFSAHFSSFNSTYPNTLLIDFFPNAFICLVFLALRQRLWGRQKRGWWYDEVAFSGSMADKLSMYIICMEEKIMPHTETWFFGSLWVIVRLSLNGWMNWTYFVADLIIAHF